MGIRGGLLRVSPTSHTHSHSANRLEETACLALSPKETIEVWTGGFVLALRTRKRLNIADVWFRFVTKKSKSLLYHLESDDELQQHVNPECRLMPNRARTRIMSQIPTSPSACYVPLEILLHYAEEMLGCETPQWKERGT
jgi:hypothetical protein